MILAFLSLGISAQPISVNFFNDKPKSLAKDFYISQFLKQPISDKEAAILLPQVKNLNPKLKHQFAQYIDKFKRQAYCQKLKGSQFLGKSADCIKMGLSLYQASKLPDTLVDKIAKEIENNLPARCVQYLAVKSKKFNNLILLPPKLLIDTFNHVGTTFRKAHYDHPLPIGLMPLLTKEKTCNIMIEKIVRGEYKNLQQSIIDINASQLSSESNFLLFLNALRYGQVQPAKRYLDFSIAHAPMIFERDKSLFWKYLLTHDKNILETLTQSHEINIYSLQAYEILGQFPANIVTSIKTKLKKSPFAISDPFAWIDFKNRIKKMKFKDFEAKKAWIMQQSAPENTPHIARLLYRFQDKTRYYLTPYSQYLKDTSLKRKILIFALARQESHFIPSEVSYSYALGMMQFMPFVAKDIAQKEGIKSFQYAALFQPKTAYQFANIHLDFLEKSLHHPLFIAYAYNAGIGYTKRQILNKNYFKKSPYEPFWSLEMIPNAQARRYGKRVLANYAVYAKLLGLKTSLSDLLENLK